MNRRHFLKQGLLLGGTLAIGTSSAVASEPKQQKQSTAREGFVSEPSRQIPILLTTDIIVVGGGPAGIAAAISTARLGAKVTLLERYNHLGGLWTGGLVLPVNCTHGLDKEGRKVMAIHGICNEIVERLEKMNMSIRTENPIVDPEATKYLLDVMMQESGVQVIYHCYASQAIVENHEVKGILIESKSGRQAVMAKYVIDTTGDGDIFAWAGENFDTNKFKITLATRLGNCDRIDTQAAGYKKIKLGTTSTPLPGVLWRSASYKGQADQDGLDVLNLSRIQQEQRINIWKDFENIHQTPGYDKVYLLDTASQLGVRATRALLGQYRLTLEDSVTFKTFDDCIGICGAWISLPYKDSVIARNKRPIWQIPYRAILPRQTRNLLVAGRCFSYDRSLLEDAREIGTCMVTGQAAGVASALALKARSSVQEIDRKKLSQTLKSQNVWLGE